MNQPLFEDILKKVKTHLKITSAKPKPIHLIVDKIMDDMYKKYYNTSFPLAHK